MAELRRLAPHDPVPETGRFLLVMRRFGEDAPRVAIVELIASDGENAPVLTIPLSAGGEPLGFEDAVRMAARQADRDGLSTVYAVDRTAGPRERDALAAGGDRTGGMDQLIDTDPDQGEPENGRD